MEKMVKIESILWHQLTQYYVSKKIHGITFELHKYVNQIIQFDESFKVLNVHQTYLLLTGATQLHNFLDNQKLK